MKISIGWDDQGYYWIVQEFKGKKTLRHGPFTCVRDACIVSIEMMADRLFEKHGHTVVFMEGKFV